MKKHFFITKNLNFFIVDFVVRDHYHHMSKKRTVFYSSILIFSAESEFLKIVYLF